MLSFTLIYQFIYKSYKTREKSALQRQLSEKHVTLSEQISFVSETQMSAVVL